MSQAEDNEKQVEFHFIKSNYFRVIHVDGAWGGISPNGLIQMSVFNQRRAIPQVVTETVKLEDGEPITIGQKRSGKSGIVREVEVDLLMSLETATALYNWLGNHIAKLNKLSTKPTGGGDAE